MDNKNSKLIIAGAGPGDPELISVKALNAIKNADVILYDALINTELLKNSKENCIKIFVGKRANKHLINQVEICKLCVDYVKSFKTVLRLKGGDPFIFGRGFEEMDYARKRGINVEIIPGISSSTSLSGLSGIPLTCRGINHGFNVITAVDRFGNLTKELINAADSGLTTVILMGFSRLKEISELYESLGKGDIPAIVISNGSTESEEKYCSVIKNLYKEIEYKNVKMPATIIVGEVVKLFEEYGKSEKYEYVVSDISEAV